VLAQVTVPYVDTSAAALGLWLDLPRQPALQELKLRVEGIAVELRVLGASHQVVAGGLTETVACLPGLAPSPLPPARAEVVAGMRHAFASRVETLRPGRLRLRAAELRERCEADERALAGVFPGSPDAVTAIGCAPVTAGRGGVSWWTVHVYPGSGEVVTTQTLLERL